MEIRDKQTQLLNSSYKQQSENTIGKSTNNPILLEDGNRQTYEIIASNNQSHVGFNSKLTASHTRPSSGLQQMSPQLMLPSQLHHQFNNSSAYSSLPTSYITHNHAKTATQSMPGSSYYQLLHQRPASKTSNSANTDSNNLNIGSSMPLASNMLSSGLINQYDSFSLSQSNHQMNSPGSNLVDSLSLGQANPLTRTTQQKVSTAGVGYHQIQNSRKMQISSNSVINSSLQSSYKSQNSKMQFDKDRIVDKEESIVNLLRKREILASKLVNIERKRLVGMKVSSIHVRSKNIHDSLLDEVKWMAIDFRQELRWKLSASSSAASLCREQYQITKLAKTKASMQSAADSALSSKTLTTTKEDIYLLRKEKASKISVLVNEFWTSLGNLRNEVSHTDPSANLENVISEIEVKSNPQIQDEISTDFGITILDHQKEAITKISNYGSTQKGCVLVGRRCVGKSIVIVASINSWLENRPPHDNNNSSKQRQVLLFVSRRSVIRWVSEFERIAPSKSARIWLPSTNTQIPSDKETDLKDASYSSTIPSFDIILCVLESIDLYLTPQNCDIISKICLGIVVDLRGLELKHINSDHSKEHWSSSLSSALSPDVKHKVLIWEGCISTFNFPSFLLYLDRERFKNENVSSSDIVKVPSDDSDWKRFLQNSILDPMNSENISSSLSMDSNSVSPNLSSSKQQYAEYVVAMSVTNVLDSFAAAQVRDEIIPQDMDSLQQLKYFQVMDSLLQQKAFNGENPWVLSQALCLLRRVCFHEAFVSLGTTRKLSNSLSQASRNEKFDDNLLSRSSEISLPFGISSGSLKTGLAPNSTFQVLPETYAFSEILDSSMCTVAKSSYTYVDKSLLKTLKSYMQQFRNADGSDTSYSSANKSYPVSFSPGPLSTKLYSPAKFNMNGNFYDSIGSCKLQGLCLLLPRFQGLRTVVVVSTVDEQLVVHSFLSRLGYEHTYAGIPSSKVDSDIITDGCYSELKSWLVSQSVIQKFNRTPLAASALMIATKEVFQHPGLIPWKADAVILLSNDWISPSDIRSCFRLRLNSAGPSGDPLTVVRIVAKSTLEEVVARRNSLLNIQGLSVAEIFPACIHASVIGSQILSRAPNANILMKLSREDSVNFPIVSTNMISQGSSSSVDFMSSNAQALEWLLVYRLAMIVSELMFSRLSKHVPLQLLPSHIVSPWMMERYRSDCDIVTLSNFQSYQEITTKLLDNLIVYYVNIQSTKPSRSECISHEVIPLINHTSPTITLGAATNHSDRNLKSLTLLIRLLDGRVRDFVVESSMANVTTILSSKSIPSTQKLRFQMEGLGSNHFTRAKQKILHLFHPRLSSLIQYNEIFGLDSQSNSDISADTFGFRVSLLFRSLREQARKLGIPLDNHIYSLYHSNEASPNEFIISGERKCSLSLYFNQFADMEIDNIIKENTASSLFEKRFSMDLTKAQKVPVMYPPHVNLPSIDATNSNAAGQKSNGSRNNKRKSDASSEQLQEGFLVNEIPFKGLSHGALVKVNELLFSIACQICFVDPTFNITRYLLMKFQGIPGFSCHTISSCEKLHVEYFRILPTLKQLPSQSFDEVCFNSFFISI